MAAAMPLATRPRHVTREPRRVLVGHQRGIWTMFPRIGAARCRVWEATPVPTPPCPTTAAGGAIESGRNGQFGPASTGPRRIAMIGAEPRAGNWIRTHWCQAAPQSHPQLVIVAHRIGKMGAAAREMIEGRRTDTMPDYPRVGRENIPGATEKGVPRAVGDPSSATRQAREPGPTSQGARSPARTERANPNQITAPGPELPRAAVGGGPGSLTRQPSSPQAPRQIRPTAPPTTPRATESRPRVETPQPRAAPRVERPAPAAPSVREARPIPPGAVERGSGARARARSEEERNKGK